MFVLKLTQVRARCWRGYTQNRTGWLPKRMSWMEPEAAAAFRAMNETCGNRIEYLDVYRSATTQMLAIKSATRAKRRLYAPPTKSGHGFGFSIDVAVKETLENFKSSGLARLAAAAVSRRGLGAFMAQFGWSGISKENWHFNHLGQWHGTAQKINAVYGPALRLDDADVQRAINAVAGSRIRPLVVDGVLGPVTKKAAVVAARVINCPGDAEKFEPWFRRLLAGMSVVVEEV